MTPSMAKSLLSTLLLALAFFASPALADDFQTYDVPIYVQGNESPSNYWIYVSQNADASNAVPYLFDTGSPNMFTVQGSNTATAATGTFTFGDGDPVYGYYTQAQTLTLTTNTSTAVTPTVANFNTAMVVTINGNTVSGNALADGTYGDFGAGLYGTSTLSTLLTAIPLGTSTKLGYIVNVAGLTTANTVGTLTVGLTQARIDELNNTAGAIVLDMNHSADQIQSYKGPITGYDKGQAHTTVTVDTESGPASADLPTVFDTGGGPNGVIYYSDDSTDPGLFDGLNPNGSFSLAYDDLIFDSWDGISPWGGYASVIGNQHPDENRVNGGGYLFENYIVMFNLEDAKLTLVPYSVPEPSTVALLIGVAALGLPLLRRRRR